MGDGDPRSDPTERICELNRGRAMIEELTLTCTEFRPIHRNTLHEKNWRRDIAIMQQIAADWEDCS